MFVANAAPFKDRFLSSLYPKDESQAAEIVPTPVEFKSDEILVKFKDSPSSTIRTRISSDANSKIEYQQASESAGLTEFDNYARRTNVSSIEPVFTKNKTGAVSVTSLVLNKWYKIKLLESTQNAKLDSAKYVELQSRIDSIKRLSDVETAELNAIIYPLYTPNDPQISQQWHLPKIAATTAWNSSRGSPEVKVAVLDTGIFKDHVDLSGKVVSEVDFTGSLFGPLDKSANSHGTHVAGIIAATIDNSHGIVGVAPNISLVNVKVISDGGVGSYEGVAQGIIWAANSGSSIINMSLGVTRTCPAIFQDANNYAWSKGLLVLAAGGNDGKSGIDTPANCPNVTSVAATNQNDEKASISNYDPKINFAAPGDSIYSTHKDGGYFYLTGTSMAVPMVAGVSGLIKSIKPSVTNAEIITILENTADKIPQTGSYWKSGRVNAKRAVESILPPRAIFGDFDGDKRADYAVFRPSNSNWHIKTRTGDLGGGFGGNGDIPVIGDYNGDGKMDKAVYRPSVNTWYIDNENPNGTVMGQTGDLPVPGDYNGDGKTDKAMYQIASGTWETTGGNIGWGRPNPAAIAVPADYNGDGKVEPAWFLPSTGAWFIQSNPSSVMNWGGLGDIPVPADYNGDGKAEPAVFRFGTWYISNQDPNGTSWGAPGDIPVPADYNGDGKADFALFRPSNGTWYPHPSGGFSVNGIILGQNGDIPAEKRPAYPGYPF